MDDSAILVEQIDALAARAERSFGDSGLLAQIEGMLSDGYTFALSGEARMIRLDEQLDALLNSADEGRARELRTLMREHRAIEQSIELLRAALAGLHREFVALGGARLELRS
jgi:hypothetical protein